MAGEHTAFFYGTLMAPEVFFSVTYGTHTPSKAIRDLHTFTPATIDGYVRYRVRFADYPAMVEEKGQSIKGIYATGLTDEIVRKLDYFEGPEYKKVDVKVTLLNKDGDKEVPGDSKDTSAYLFTDTKQLDRQEWNFEEFRTRKMQLWTRGDWNFEENA